VTAMHPNQLVAILAAVITSLKADVSPFEALSLAEGIVDAQRSLTRADAVAARENAKNAEGGS
jgi:hypothetical protein